jgi:quinol monooxygenase YgiN
VLVIAGVIRIDPSRREEAIREAVEVARAARREPGCISYAFSADLEEPNLFRVFEEWESQEALDRHFETPHMLTFQGRVAGLGVKEMTVEKYRVESVGPVV